MNPKIDGTPKTLEEAVACALCVGPLKGMPERTRAVMRDYLAQKFGVAMMKHPEQNEMLCELWAAITGEPCERLKP